MENDSADGPRRPVSLVLYASDRRRLWLLRTRHGMTSASQAVQMLLTATEWEAGVTVDSKAGPACGSEDARTRIARPSVSLPARAIERLDAKVLACSGMSRSQVFRAALRNAVREGRSE